MGHASKGPLALALLIMAVGAGWLLNAIGIGPEMDWVWILGLGVMGILTFIISSGIDKASIVLGTLFLLASGLSVLRQSGMLSMEIELPILVIATGVLLFIAQCRFVPAPNWILPLDGEQKK